jgi:hypothetical protein
MLSVRKVRGAAEDLCVRENEMLCYLGKNASSEN